MKYSFKEFTTNQIIEKAQYETIFLYKDNRYIGCFTTRDSECEVAFCEGYDNKSMMMTINNGKAVLTVIFDEIEC